MNRGTLVVGASQAGVELAVAMRRLGDTAPITLAGAEPAPPYERPPLSKAYLAGTVDQASLSLRAPQFFAERRIDVVSGCRVARIESTPDAAAGAGLARTVDGRVFPFDRLALTVGARARRLVVPGADLRGVHYLRTVADAMRLRRHLDAARRVVVIGGGFIGLEVASVARTLGKDVTVVEAAGRLMARSVAPAVSAFYHDAHRRRGVEMCLGVGVVALHGQDGRIVAVELADGRRLPADLVIVGVGIVPRTGLAAQLGLACEGGIIVDAHARTSDPSIVAAGDCTVSPHPLTGAGRYRLESVPHATAQARIAAATLLGLSAPPPDVPWFWSDQYDLKLQIAGLSDGYDQCVVRGASADSISVLYYRDGVLLAVNAVNRVADYFDVRRALARGATIPAQRASDPDIRLSTLTIDPADA